MKLCRMVIMLPILCVLYVYIYLSISIYKDRACVISLKCLKKPVSLMQMRYSSICCFIPLQQQLPSSAQELNLETSSDPTLCTWRCLMGGRCWPCGELGEDWQSGPRFSLLVGGWVFSILSSFLLHYAKLDSSQTRVKLGYAAVAEFPKCNFLQRGFFLQLAPISV